MNIHRDFYNLRKVDNVIDHAAALNVTSFLDFVRHKVTVKNHFEKFRFLTVFQREAHTEVLVDHKTNKVLTLDNVFEKYHLKARVFTIEDLEIKVTNKLNKFFLLDNSHIWTHSENMREE